MRAIIIGGGIGGLTAALALRAKGIESEVFEKSPELREVGAGISLWANATKALRELGLGDGLDAISLMNQEGVVRRWNGTFLSRTPAQELQRRFGAGVIVLHRAELLDLLARALGPEKIQPGRVCTSVQQDATGVTANFAVGAPARADILIGADGLHSVVRTALGHKDPIRYSGYTAWRAVVPFDSSLVIPGETWGRGNRFGLLPMKGGRVYWFATSNAPEREQESPAGAKQHLLSLFKGWHQPIEDLLRASPDAAILRNDIYDRDPLPTWGTGRITLLGDAAHPMTPNLGQGGCQAIEDALELAGALSCGPEPVAALKDYEASRTVRTRSIVLTSRRLGAMGQMTNPFLCFLRDLVFKLTPARVTVGTLAPAVGYEGHLSK